MDNEELTNLVGFLVMDITKIQNHMPILNNPKSTKDELTNAHTVIDNGLQRMVQVLHTAMDKKGTPMPKKKLLESHELAKLGIIKIPDNVSETSS